MANIKQQKKRVLQNEKRRQRNIDVRSRVKTFVKKAETTILSAGADAADAVRTAIIELDVAARKGVLHKNTAARKKSRLMKKINAKKA
jgi:small subunit ribosomal protein S20